MTFEEFVADHGQSLLRLAFVLTGDRHLAEDLTQTALPGLGQDGLTISRVVQGSFLDMDEQGTEAAAATGVGMAISGSSAGDVVTLDRPYLLLLTDTVTHSPLILAVVNDPSA